MAKTIAGNAPIAVRQAKQAIHKGLQMGLMDGLAFEIEAYNRTIPTKDRREGVLAFNERRSPVFKGKKRPRPAVFRGAGFAPSARLIWVGCD